MTCEICNRSNNNLYCEYHDQAYKNLQKGYKIWKHSYGSDFTWRRYLEKTIARSETGEWVKEVAKIQLTKIKTDDK